MSICWELFLSISFTSFISYPFPTFHSLAAWWSLLWYWSEVPYMMLIFFFVFLFFFLLKVICSLKFQFCENFSKRQPVTEVNFYGVAHWYIRQMDPLSNKKICLWCFCLFPPCPSPPGQLGPLVSNEKCLFVTFLLIPALPFSPWLVGITNRAERQRRESRRENTPKLYPTS